jgi:hypothetical protein
MASITDDGSQEPHPVAKKLLSITETVLGVVIITAVGAGFVSAAERVWGFVTGAGWKSQPLDQFVGLQGRLEPYELFQWDCLLWLWLIIPIALIKLGEGIAWMLDPKERTRSRDRREKEKSAQAALEDARKAKRQVRRERVGERGRNWGRGLRKVLRSIWNGPFVAPPVPAPVTVGWVLLKICETIWRFVVAVISAAILIACSVWVWSLLNPPLKDQMIISAEIGNAACPKKDQPLLLDVTNRSSRTIGDWAVSFSTYELGRSTNLSESSLLRMDYVIAPYENITFCLSRPELGRAPEGPVRYRPQIEWANELEK